MIKRRNDGEIELNLGIFTIPLSLKSPTPILLILIAAGLWWWQGQVMIALQSIKTDVVKTDIGVQAIIEAMPPSQQQAAKKNIADRMQAIKMAEAVGEKQP